MKIAIDGPAGAGKSTIAKALAERLGINYLDTGAMYRAVGYAMAQAGIDVQNPTDVEHAMASMEVDVAYGEQGQRVMADGWDVTDFIRTSQVAAWASAVAVVPAVRHKLVQAQRRTGEQSDIVMDGRDIGTYVLPDAELKFFITATPRQRAIRRHLEFAGAGISKTVEELEAEIVARDKNDSEREFAPLRQAEDAILLDTTELSIEEVLDAVMQKIKEVYGNVL